MIEREQLALPGAPNEVWSIDFVMDALSNGRRVKCLTVVDDFTKEAVDIVVDHGISGLYVARALDVKRAARKFGSLVCSHRLGIATEASCTVQCPSDIQT